MPIYDIIATLANLVRPYAGNPVVKIDPRDGTKIHRRWPIRAAEDVDFIDVFGQLQDNAAIDGNAVTLVYDPRIKDPAYRVVPYGQEDPRNAWQLKLPDPANLVEPRAMATTYMIHKGFRVPYSFQVKRLDDAGQLTDVMEEVHANIFVLFTGWAEP